MPGTFVYSPAAGTALGAGSDTLSVTFTPTDTVDYNVAAATALINVLPATPTPIGPGSSASQGKTVIGATQTFRWNQVTDAAGYVLDVQDVTTGAATKSYTISSGSTTSDAMGLIAGHTYQWQMCACTGSAMSPLSAMYHFTIAPDATPPQPNPIGWSKFPHATSSTTISMTAKIASDPSGVQYYFHNMTVSGHDSGWQTSRTYTDTRLLPGTTYKYEVKTRDLSPNHNKGKYSTPRLAKTLSAAAHGTMAKRVGTGAILNEDALSFPIRRRDG